MQLYTRVRKSASFLNCLNFLSKGKEWGEVTLPMAVTLNRQEEQQISSPDTHIFMLSYLTVIECMLALLLAQDQNTNHHPASHQTRSH